MKKIHLLSSVLTRSLHIEEYEGLKSGISKAFRDQLFSLKLHEGQNTLEIHDENTGRSKNGG